MKYEAVIFDFDGTLADTETLLRAVLNSLSDEFGFEPIAEHEMGVLRQMSARELLTKRLKIPAWNIWKAARLERRGKKVFVEQAAEIALFPGIADLLKRLREERVRTGIVSSNMSAIVERALLAEDAAVDFMVAGFSVFGKARALKKAIRRHAIDRRSCVYVGDELRDVEACRIAGLPMIGVGWGLNTPEALAKEGVDVVSSVQELREKLLT